MKSVEAKPYVVLKGIERGNVFYSSNTPGKDPTKSATGKTWFEVLGYADTGDEARLVIDDYNVKRYGDADFPLKRYLADLAIKLESLERRI
jgi:hypothetical protein